MDVVDDFILPGNTLEIITTAQFSKRKYHTYHTMYVYKVTRIIISNKKRNPVASIFEKSRRYKQ